MSEPLPLMLPTEGAAFKIVKLKTVNTWKRPFIALTMISFCFCRYIRYNNSHAQNAVFTDIHFTI